MMVGYNGHNRDLLNDLPYRRRHESTASILDAIELRTQKTYRYGIILVCIGATLNWLGFAQGNSYIDPLRYLGVASVISGSFCVCLAMCRWLGRPMSGHLSSLEEDSLSSSRSMGDVHVINVAVPNHLFVSSTNEFRVSKPPEYAIVAGVELPPPNYDEAIKLSPNGLLNEDGRNQSYSSSSGSEVPPSPSHTSNNNIGDNEPNKSIENTSLSPESPPPPYHSNPSRFSNLPSINHHYLNNNSNILGLNRSVSIMNAENSEVSMIQGGRELAHRFLISEEGPPHSSSPNNQAEEETVGLLSTQFSPAEESTCNLDGQNCNSCQFTQITLPDEITLDSTALNV